MSSTSGSDTSTENPQPLGFAVLPIFVLEDSDLGDHEVRVLLALSSYTGASGSCWPSLRTLATRCGGSSKRQLARIFNGYTRGAERVPGLVEKGYVRVELRQSRSNVYRLSFDRWSGQKGGDTGVIVSCPEPPDTGAREGATPVPGHIKEVEQDHRNNRTPQPPAKRGARLTREDKDQIHKARRATKHIVETFGSCATCHESLSSDVLEVQVQDGALTRWASPLVQLSEDYVVIKGKLEPREGEADPAELAAMADLVAQLRATTRPTDMRHWIEPLELVRLSEEEGESVLELACPDESHALWLEGNYLPPGSRYTLDGDVVAVRVGVVKHKWTETSWRGYHRGCAPGE